MALRVCHVSDTHGTFPRLLGTFDCVVHTGDMSPNFQMDSHEATKQMYWWEEKVEIIKRWLNGRPWLFTLGNHDFMNGYWLEAMLLSHGINAKCLHDQVHCHEGVNFYGFPYIPPIDGRWAYESTVSEMATHLDTMGQFLNAGYVDVIAAHAPPGGYLDLSFSNQRWGNSQMNSFLDYTLAKEMIPAYYLCGHIHEAHGLMMRGDMLISNAAVTHHVLEI